MAKRFRAAGISVSGGFGPNNLVPGGGGSLLASAAGEAGWNTDSTVSVASRSIMRYRVDSTPVVHRMPACHFASR